jgi:hypothetical protein
MSDQGGKIMKIKGMVLFTVILCGILIVCGCANYKITHELEQPIKEKTFCYVGEIKDELPADFDEEDKPTFEQIYKFKRYLKNALEEKLIFSAIELGNPETEYEVTGGIRDFKKGSGLIRSPEFGMGIQKVMAALRLQDRKTGEILFAGNFKQVVSSQERKSDIMFEQVAKDFSRALEKQIKKLEKKK